MKTFSIAEQNVQHLMGGYRLEFSSDPHDSGICTLRVSSPGTPDKPNEHAADYLLLTFARNGLVTGMRMIDAEVETEARERAAAERRLAAAPASPEATEEARKAADAERAKQADADKALLAAEPKASKYEPKPDAKAPDGAVKKD